MENEKEYSPLAMGVPSHGKGRILGIFTAQSNRFYLAVLGSENGLNGRTSKSDVQPFSRFSVVQPPLGCRKGLNLGGDGRVSAEIQPHDCLPPYEAGSRVLRSEERL